MISVTQEQFEALISKLDSLQDTVIRLVDGISNLESRLDDLESTVADSQ